MYIKNYCTSNVKIYFEHLKISEILKKNNILYFNFIDHEINEFFKNNQESDFDKSIFDNNCNLKKNIFFFNMQILLNLL